MNISPRRLLPEVTNRPANHCPKPKTYPLQSRIGLGTSESSQRASDPRRAKYLLTSIASVTSRFYRFYRLLLWKVQWSLFRKLDFYLFPLDEFRHFRLLTHEMPPRDWFDRITSPDPGTRNTAYWEVRNSAIGDILDFEINYNEIMYNPRSPQRTAELKYLLTYIFGDVPLADIDWKIKTYLSALDGKNRDDRYVKLIISHLKIRYPNLKWNYYNERERITELTDEVHRLFQMLSDCMQSPAIRYSLSLVPDTLVESAKSGKSTALFTVGVDDLIENRKP